MLEISPIAPVGGSQSLWHHGLSANPRPAAPQAPQAQGTPAREEPVRLPVHRDPDMLTGPTPAFQASILEIETDLATVIARLEAARTRSRDEAALHSPVPQAPLDRPDGTDPVG